MSVSGADNEPSQLPPLQWIADERLVYDDAANEVHRPGAGARRRGEARVGADDLPRVSARRHVEPGNLTPSSVGE
jgi:hypothetical protein